MNYVRNSCSGRVRSKYWRQVEFSEQKMFLRVQGYALSKSINGKSPGNSRQKGTKRESDLKGKSHVLSRTNPAVVLEQTGKKLVAPRLQHV
jgi:hypothetical protein